MEVFDELLETEVAIVVQHLSEVVNFCLEVNGMGGWPVTPHSCRLLQSPGAHSWPRLFPATSAVPGAPCGPHSFLLAALIPRGSLMATPLS